MLNGISPYGSYAAYGTAYTNRAALTRGPEQAQAAQRPAPQWGLQKAAQPEAPVQPVTPARPVTTDEDPAASALLRYNSDPAAVAVRMRIQQPGDPAAAQQAQAPVLPGQKTDGAEQPQALTLPGQKVDGAEQAKALPLPGQKDAAQAANPLAQEKSSAVEGPKSAQEVMEEGECQTCKERKYQDGSDDPGVSFKTPTNVAPELAASAVRGHENEHVVREQAKAQREDRKVVSQSVTYHTAICPECGKVYVSGGTTRTVTRAAGSQQTQQQPKEGQDAQAPFSSVA